MVLKILFFGIVTICGILGILYLGCYFYISHVRRRQEQLDKAKRTAENRRKHGEDKRKLLDETALRELELLEEQVGQAAKAQAERKRREAQAQAKARLQAERNRREAQEEVLTGLNKWKPTVDQLDALEHAATSGGGSKGTQSSDNDDKGLRQLTKMFATTAQRLEKGDYSSSL